MRTLNTVVAGDYEGRKVKIRGGRYIEFCRPFAAPVAVDSGTVDKYDVILEDVSKDGVSVFLRSYLGKRFLGTPGMIAGYSSAKNKNVVTVSILFKNGDKSLIEIDQKTYKILMRRLFA